MANTKLTKKDKFIMVLEMVKDNPTLAEFIKHEIELLEKKATGSDKAKAKKNAETEKLKADLLVALAEYGEPVTVTDFHDKSPSTVATLSVSKLTSLLTSLKADGKVVRTEIKKRPFYSVVVEVIKDMEKAEIVEDVEKVDVAEDMEVIENVEIAEDMGE